MSLKPALIQRISSPSDTLSMQLTSPGCSGVMWVLLLTSAASVLLLNMCLMCCRSRDCASETFHRITMIASVRETRPITQRGSTAAPLFSAWRGVCL